MAEIPIFDTISGDASDLEPVTATTLDGDKPTELLALPTELPVTKFQTLLNRAQALSGYVPTVSISSKYYEFTKVGESVRGVFLGFSTIGKKGEDGGIETIPVAQWLAPDGSLYVNGGVALVRTLEAFNVPQGTPIEITYEGKRDRTKIFDVRILGGAQ